MTKKLFCLAFVVLLGVLCGCTGSEKKENGQDPQGKTEPPPPTKSADSDSPPPGNITELITTLNAKAGFIHIDSVTRIDTIRDQNHKHYEVAYLDKGMTKFLALQTDPQGTLFNCHTLFTCINRNTTGPNICRIKQRKEPNGEYSFECPNDSRTKNDSCSLIAYPLK